MQITRASDYAVRVLIHLAGLPAGSTVRQSELAQATAVPGHFLSKVLQQLVRSGFIRSHRGSGGGFALTVDTKTVSLLEIVEAIEGPIRLNQCLEEGPSCERKPWCPAHRVWAEAQAAVVKVLGSASVAQLAAVFAAELGVGQGHPETKIWITGVPTQNSTRRIRRPRTR
ncbi:MAG TPA: Rrf2 family transcriptional regulator [Verrucomicrobiae bacterium]|jgi:Rrf2 family protein|nr:Rrf2 family transcriptional regulator [Verrucomicrobiae bacterium]